MNYFYQFSITIHLCYISNARCILKLVILLWKNAWYFWLLIYSLGWRNILFLQKYNQNEFFKETTQIFKILGKLNFIEIAALYIRCFSFKWNLHCFTNNIDLAQLFCVSLLLLRDGEGMSQYMYIAFISSQVFMWYIAFKLHIFQFRFVLLTWRFTSGIVIPLHQSAFHICNLFLTKNLRKWYQTMHGKSLHGVLQKFHFIVLIGNTRWMSIQDKLNVWIYEEKN